MQLTKRTSQLYITENSLRIKTINNGFSGFEQKGQSKWHNFQVRNQALWQDCIFFYECDNSIKVIILIIQKYSNMLI